MLKKSLIIMFILMFIAGMALSGCSQTTQTTQTATTSQTTSTTSSTPTTTLSTSTPITSLANTTITPSTTTGTAANAQYGGTLRIISDAEVTSYMVGEMYSPEDMLQRIPSIETLVRYDAVQQLVVPFLAENAIEDPIGKTVTFKLRNGVNFQDGTVCDANAIKWNLDTEMKAANTSPDFVDVSSIDVIDNLTVKVSFSTWDNSFLREMCWDSAVISPTAFQKNGLDWARINPCGTGPFKLVTFQRDVKKVFQKWDGYWQKGKPYLDTVEIDIIADPTVALASLLKGDDDVYGGLLPSDVKTVQGNAGLNVVLAPQVEGAVMDITGDSANPSSPFSNLMVRQAISYAIDRDSIQKYIFDGYAEVTNGINSPDCWTNSPNVHGYPYNPAKAKELLSEAGYRNGFSTTIYCRPEKYFTDTATTIQSNLADIGIQATVQVLDTGAYGAMMFGSGWTNGLFIGNMAGDPELGVVARFFLSKAAGIGYSNSIIHPDDVEAAINQMMTATDNVSKQQAAWVLDALAIDVYCMLTPILTSPTINALSNKVHDPNFAEGFTYADAWIEH